MRTVFVALPLLLCLGIYAQAQEQLNLTEGDWIKDIDFLVKSVKATVPDFELRVNQDQFVNQVSDLKQHISTKPTEEIIWGMQRILNLVEDDGCNVMPFQRLLNPKLVPIKSYWFKDGLYICDASANYANLKGAQIIKINNVEIEELLNKLSTSMNTDNDYYRKYLFSLYAINPSLLNSYNIGKSNDNLDLEFASGETATVQGEDLSEYRKLKRKLPNDGEYSFTKANHKNDYYWLEYLPNTKTLFVQLQWIYNKKEDISFLEFVKIIENEIEDGNTTKMILDLRYGGGGNGFKFKPFTDLLRDAKKINKKGNLFVLTSRETRGAILELASVLELNTKSIFVGEPTAEGPNTVGDTKQITLPNSGLTISLTKVFWPTSWAKDKRNTIESDISVNYTYNNYKANQDPWLEAVSNYSLASSTKSLPNDLVNSLEGTYKIEGRKVTIEEKGGKLFLSMKRPIKSFFEIRTELHYVSEGVLSTDISGVLINYKVVNGNNTEMTNINWKGIPLKAEN